MDDTEAVRALAALANPHRLVVFRALVRAGGEGLSAGELAGVAGIAASALTFHTKELERAGLIETRREGRFIRSALNVPVMRSLISFLADDCCAGRPDLCGVAPVTAPNLAAEDPCCAQPIKTKKVTT
jgi:ArsR family transcriptional regulator, arsenate/arsenite/antimonite-responsive transcriptional repressor